MRVWITSAVVLAVVWSLASCTRPQAKVLGLGVDVAGFDTTVRPQDDFFRYVNGGWLDRTPIPEDRSRFGAFDELQEAAEANLRAIVEEFAAGGAEAGSERRKVGDLYASFMDENRVEELGAAPLQRDLASIAAVASVDELVTLFGAAPRSGWSAPLGLFVNQDQGQSDRYIVYLTQSGLGMPDRDFYFRNDPRSRELVALYRATVERLLGLAGLPDPDRAAEVVVALETRIAGSHWTRVQNRDRQATYNLMKVSELVERTPGFPWIPYLGAAELADVEEVIVRQPDYLDALADLVRAVPLEDWKTYLAWQLVRNAAPILSRAFVEAHFDFFGRALQGTTELRPRWRRGVGVVNGSLGDALGKIYVERHFPPEAKERMERLVANLKVAFGQAIDELEWMSEATKQEARAKLDRFGSKIGYPDKWKDYSALEIRRDDLVGNLRRSGEVEYRRRIGKLGQPIDRGEWFMTPQTVNAYYTPNLNEVVFPAAILQPPFFHLGADEAVNYGAIGGVIGHEITHGFDDQGRRSDGEGNLRDWWTPEDEERFRARAQVLVDQFSAYEPLPGVPINGQLALGENIADLGGLTVAHRAYLLSLGDREAPVIDGFTGSQRVFLGWAQVWRTQYRDEALRTQLMTGPHSPGPYRVRGPLSNMPEFYAAFGVQEGDGMFRPAAERAKIW